MTEIPEHLLKRSKERRAAMGLGEGEATTETPAASEPAPSTAPEPVPAAPPAAPPAPAEVAPAPPPQVPASVAAYRRRRRVPFWAMPVLAGLPLWAYIYQGTLEPPAAGEDDPVALGQELYGAGANCAACHGAGGGGGSGPPMTDVVQTWPDARDHVMWVRLGSDGWPADTYGATDKPKNGGMPGFADLTDAELAQVVLYERQVLGGEDPANLADLIAVALGEKTFADLGLGEESESAGVDESNLEGSG